MAYRRYQGFKQATIWILIGVNFLLFVATLIAPNLILILGLRPAVFFNSPWTIVTNLFTHSGLWHIIANMITLYFFGTYLFRLIGERRFLIIYFGGGIAGNIFYLLLAYTLGLDFYNIAVGASGAIFALGGALSVLVPKLRVFIFPIPVPLPLWVAVIGGFVILSFLPFIAWQAHLGGLAFGLITGYFFKRKVRYLV
jgi:membrane associated rhomboid family serine protease